MREPNGRSQHHEARPQRQGSRVHLRRRSQQAYSGGVSPEDAGQGDTPRIEQLSWTGEVMIPTVAFLAVALSRRAGRLITPQVFQLDPEHEQDLHNAEPGASHLRQIESCPPIKRLRTTSVPVR